MKILRIEMTVVDGATACAVYDRTAEGIKQAMSEHHSVMASALANPNCTEVLSMVINSDGGIYANERWKAEEVAE